MEAKQAWKTSWTKKVFWEVKPKPPTNVVLMHINYLEKQINLAVRKCSMWLNASVEGGKNASDREKGPERKVQLKQVEEIL